MQRRNLFAQLAVLGLLPTIGRAENTKDRNEVARINAWTVGLAAGQREGAPLQFATDIARVVNDGDNLKVLPIVTGGPTENVEDLLYLRGVDVAIINSDVLDQFKIKMPDIQQKISYLLNLFPSELHVFVGPGINSIEELRGKRVNFNTQGTAAAYSGPIIFDKLKLDIQKMFIPHQVALEKMRNGGDMDCVVFITSKPVDAFQKGKWPDGFKFLPVPWDDFTFYLPTTLTPSDYPQLVKQDVQTIAIPTCLAVFNWPKGSNRYARVERLTDMLFDRLDTLQGPGFHPKWKDVVLNAEVPGLSRFRAAQEWLDKGKSVAQVSASRTVQTMTPDNQRLWQEFLEWRKTH